MRIHVRSPYNYNRELVSRETSMPDDQDSFPSRTIQSGKAEADINVIVRRFGITGQMQAPARLPSYGDYTGISDFQDALNVVRAAQEQFASLSSDVRASFGNDPNSFLHFASDPENLPTMVRMGLAIPRPSVIIHPSDSSDVSKGKNDGSGTGDGDGTSAKATSKSGTKSSG